ncbi:MAG TPA: hypothetical protein VGQ24_15960 [Gemmatimonadales bacterium]|jgi:hypothetical protein|nr:hypothetical protein [Gemmatimonadales bacterium]
MLTHLAPLRRALIPFVALAAFTISSCGPDGREPTGPGLDPNLALQSQPGLAKALAAQARHTDRLLQIEGIVGTAVGLGSDGHEQVQLFTKTAGVRGLPTTLDGVPVSVVVTGEIRALPAVASAPITAAAVNRTARFARPVPIGVSTGNQGECSAGTIGARVKSGTTTYALSNNHVYALENRAAIGSNVLQPGRYDLNCASGSNALLGKLSKFVSITFSTSANNKVDAAIAAAPITNLGKSTPSDGYGAPSPTIIAAALNQTVKKYGRTTGLTTGSVVGLNATINVGYSRGTARFVGQIVIRGKGQFSRAGDSGSLIVNGNRRPVGLLFAGSQNGYTFANQIGQVLTALGVSVDGI